ncbi:MAG: response regulator [Flavobacteriia bacterium]|nr:response regulator [Flavobacteriia bacterium]OIP46765.1 MAG: two-component system response regulator [Flavobacteriaceae bacterium CG2_30_31_66]PIV95821.1 MAG: response regulator [Flavobacteriaceae bacterium CG17_big_fil_post_rev_8_21_14_2_50_31_13]PIX15463.1 MAG: response regulator [Flavobacteriaceae bacterium CG_4_8_14_3_um_filter_31_8]PIY16110.1 MAG: response regulator [Flavobacteriaceae bacterium CG_4_10_14_3_um_filter_31_253]PIZ11336.1 MAG: response regulator [Flavobacteriaceae bacteriu
MNSRKTHILLVEDNEGDIILTLDAFEESKLGNEVSVARNGKEALEFLFHKGNFVNAKKPDLVLLDINLPFFNGIEILEKIKTNDDLKKIPVIMLTTSNRPEDIKNAYNNHCNGYIEKPLDMEKFLSVILKIEEFWLQINTLAV